MRISDWSSDVCSSDLFVPAFTFVATAEVVPLAGATPFFVDVRERDFNLDPASLEAGIAEAERVGLRPRVVIPVDLFGHPADYDGINEIAARHGMTVVADAAQARTEERREGKECVRTDRARGLRDHTK